MFFLIAVDEFRSRTLGAGGGLLLLGFVIVALCMGADPADIMRVLQDAPVAQQQPLPGQPPGQIPADLDGPGQAVWTLMAELLAS